jgi:hypothetical protein
MADNHVDYIEVGEYGDHFVSEGKKLVGLWPGVDVNAVIEHVAAAVSATDGELEKVGIKRSALRGDRDTTKEKAAGGRKEIERFYSFLGSLDDDIEVDHNAFFADGNLGALKRLKPADVKGRLDEVLKGFAAEKNAGLPDKDKWQAKLTKARDELATSLGSKGGALASSITGTAGLVSAREAFLVAYNGVAKPIIEGLLTKLGRRDEMRLFFKDLQVNEEPPKKKASEGPAPATGPGPQGSTPPAGGTG